MNLTFPYVHVCRTLLMLYLHHYLTLPVFKCVIESLLSRIPWADPGHFPWVRGFKNRDKISLHQVDVLLHLYIIIHFTDLSHNYTLLNPFKYDIQSACEYNY